MQSLPGTQPPLQTKLRAQAIIRGQISPDSHTDASEVQENFSRIKAGIINRSANILRQSSMISDGQMLMASGDSVAISHGGVIYSPGGFLPSPQAIPTKSSGATADGGGKFIDWEI